MVGIGIADVCWVSRFDWLACAPITVSAVATPADRYQSPSQLNNAAQTV